MKEARPVTKVRSGKKSSATAKRIGKKPSETARKGKLVEAIVAMLHDMPGVKVERNVELPPVHADRPRTRELDVLLTAMVADYPVRIAFSCKNESKKIEPGKIDEFIGELDDVDIPPQHGIFVCVNGYTSGALDRAKQKGIRTLVLRGLKKNRLASEVAKAFQFNVFLIPEVVGMVVTNTAETSEYEGQFMIFVDDKGQVCGTLADLIVNWWKLGGAPSLLGEYHPEFEVPKGWYQIIKGKPEAVLGASATVRVKGAIITLSGKAKSHALVDPLAQKVTRSQVRVDFDVARKRKVVLPVTIVNTEEELKAFTSRQSEVTITSRIRLPRIQLGATYYPWSERVFRLMIERYQKYQAGEIPDFRAFTLEETEGTDLSAALERPWYESVKGEGPPVIVTDDEGESVDVRLLMKEGEFGRVVALRPRFERSPTPEFAHFLAWAYLMQAEALIGKAAEKRGAAANRLIEQSIEKIKAALEVRPRMVEAYLKLGAAHRVVERYGEEIASYDRALALDNNNFEAWGNRVVPLLNFGRLEDALDSVNTSLDLAPQPEARIAPLLLRAYIHHLAGRYKETADDAVAAWMISPEEVVGNDYYRPLVQAYCSAAWAPETFLLFAETLWCEAADMVMDGRDRDEAVKRAEDAAQALEALRPVDENPDLTVGTVQGGLVYDVLTRSAGYLVESGDRELAKGYIERMQAWAEAVFGEPFDSLTDHLRELAKTS